MDNKTTEQIDTEAKDEFKELIEKLFIVSSEQKDEISYLKDEIRELKNGIEALHEKMNNMGKNLNMDTEE